MIALLEKMMPANYPQLDPTFNLIEKSTLQDDYDKRAVNLSDNTCWIPTQMYNFNSLQ